MHGPQDESTSDYGQYMLSIGRLPWKQGFCSLEQCFCPLAPENYDALTKKVKSWTKNPTWMFPRFRIDGTSNGGNLLKTMYDSAGEKHNKTCNNYNRQATLNRNIKMVPFTQYREGFSQFHNVCRHVKILNFLVSVPSK